MPYLVRHAHVGDKRAWAGPDVLWPLPEPGRREAHGLLTQLRDYLVTRVLSSPAVRCLQTVQPLAARRGQLLPGAVLAVLTIVATAPVAGADATGPATRPGGDLCRHRRHPLQQQPGCLLQLQRPVPVLVELAVQGHAGPGRRDEGGRPAELVQFRGQRPAGSARGGPASRAASMTRTCLIPARRQTPPWPARSPHPNHQHIRTAVQVSGHARGQGPPGRPDRRCWPTPCPAPSARSPSSSPQARAGAHLTSDEPWPTSRPPTTSRSGSTSTSCRPAAARPRPRPCTSPWLASPRPLPP
jgi:hypothetical protein